MSGRRRGVDVAAPMTGAERNARRAEQMRQRQAEQLSIMVELADDQAVKPELLARQPEYGSKRAVIEALLQEAPDPDAG